MGGDIAGLLGELRQAGRTDSRGSFTLNLERTLQKLAQFQLDNPRHYVRNLVAAAVRLGATCIQFECGPRDTRVAFDGPPLTHVELANLFQSLFESQPNARSQALAHLAYAVNATRALHCEFMILEAWGEDSGTRLQMSDGLLQVSPLQAAPWGPSRGFHHRVHVREPWSAGHLGRLHPARVAEIETLHGSCCFGPIPVWVNGHRLRPRLRILAEIQGPGAPPGDRLEGFPTVHGPFWGGAAWRPGPPTACYVVDGVAHCQELPAPVPRNIFLWAHCNELRRDVSQRALVEGPELTERRGQVTQLLYHHQPTWQHRLSRLAGAPL